MNFFRTKNNYSNRYYIFKKHPDTRKMSICKPKTLAKNSFEDTMKNIFIISYYSMNNVQKFGLMLLRVLFAIFVIALSLDIFSDPTWWEAFGSHFSFFPGDAYKTVGMIAVGVLFIGAIFVFIGALTPIFATIDISNNETANIGTITVEKKWILH